MSLWPRTLKQKTILVVVLVALLALGNVVTLQAMLRRFDDIGATVNLAGKMRMLSQRIALEALAENLAQGGQLARSAGALRKFYGVLYRLAPGGYSLWLGSAPGWSAIYPYFGSIAPRLAAFPDGCQCRPRHHSRTKQPLAHPGTGNHGRQR